MYHIDMQQLTLALRTIARLKVTLNPVLTLILTLTLTLTTADYVGIVCLKSFVHFLQAWKVP